MKKFLSIILVVFIVVYSTSISYGEVFKNETVYVNLDHNGNRENIVVVNHISGEDSIDYFIDYGNYKSLELLVSDVDYIMEDNLIKWPTSFLKEKDVYYEGKIDKDLPMDINIKYYLNGKEIEANELSAKTGNIKIVVSIKNSLQLTTQIQIPLNLDIFSNVNSNGGVTSVVGKTMTIVYNHLPVGDGEYVLEAYGENIELDSIMISATSTNIEIPGNLNQGMGELKDGIDNMSNATEELYNGSMEINKGTNSLVNGLKTLNNGIYELFSGSKEINENSNTIVGGFKEIGKGLVQLKNHIIELVSGINEMNTGLTTLNEENKSIKIGLKGLSQGIDGISKGTNEVSNGLYELNEGHKQLVELAKTLVNSSDPNVKALAQGVLGESEAIGSLNQGVSELAAGAISLSSNTNTIVSGYEEFSTGLSNIANGFNEMNEGLKPLPQELETMVAGHEDLTNGLEPLFDGIKELNSGLEKVYNKTKSIPSNVQELANGQNEISNGLLRLNEEGFGQIKDSLDQFSNLGVNEEKQPYTSFADNKNKNSNVQFVMKTPPIKTLDLDTNLEEVNEIKKKKSLLQRFLDLFR